MTLATRMIVLVAGTLVLSLLAGGLLIVAAASYWVQSEIATTARVSRELVDERLAEAVAEEESPDRLTDLLRSLETGYHVQAVFRADGEPEATVPGLPARSALSRLLGLHPMIQQIPVRLPGLPTGRVVLVVDPEPELERVQRAIELNVAVIVLFSTTTLILVALGLTRSLRPLEQLAAALSRVGTGDYSIRIAPRGPREIAMLGRQFNRMADQLRLMQARGRTLDAQMLTVKENERHEIARDLHDELGPCLLAANLDVSALVRFSRAGDRPAMEDCAAGLATVLARMQDLVRRMIGRLHLSPADDVDFTAAVDDLVAFWRDRCPEITWRIDCSPPDPTRPTMIGATLIRVLREALANAVRHSGARSIVITCTEDSDEIVLGVADDGVGMDDPGRFGLGLRGMRERIEAMGGMLGVRTVSGRGTTITARLPLRDMRALPVDPELTPT